MSESVVRVSVGVAHCVRASDLCMSECEWCIGECEWCIGECEVHE